MGVYFLCVWKCGFTTVGENTFYLINLNIILVFKWTENTHVMMVGWVKLGVNILSTDKWALCDCWKAQIKFPQKKKESIKSYVGK